MSAPNPSLQSLPGEAVKNEDLSDLQAAKDFLSSSLYGEHPLARAAHTVIRALNLANEAADMIAKEREAWKRSCLEWKSLAIKNDARCEAAEQALERMREILRIEADTFFICEQCSHQHDRHVETLDVYFLLSNALDRALNPTPQGGKPDSEEG